MPDHEQGLTRREAIKKGLKILGGAAVLGALGSMPPAETRRSTDLEIKATRFNEVMTKVAEALNWRTRTAPTSGINMANRCLSFNETQDWTGCVGTFNGFETPTRNEGFRPAAYLIYGYGDYLSNEDSGQRLFVYPGAVEGLAANSGEWGDGSLLNTFEQQKEAAKKFGFPFPATMDDPLPEGTVGPIGFWGLSEEEHKRIGNISINLP